MKDLKKEIWEQALKENRIVCAECKTIVVSKTYCYWCYHKTDGRTVMEVEELRKENEELKKKLAAKL